AFFIHRPHGLFEAGLGGVHGGAGVEGAVGELAGLGGELEEGADGDGDDRADEHGHEEQGAAFGAGGEGGLGGCVHGGGGVVRVAAQAVTRLLRRMKRAEITLLVAVLRVAWVRSARSEIWICLVLLPAATRLVRSTGLVAML